MGAADGVPVAWRTAASDGSGGRVVLGASCGCCSSCSAQGSLYASRSPFSCPGHTRSDELAKEAARRADLSSGSSRQTPY